MIKNAKIINNFPCCPICEDNPQLGNMDGNYRQVIHNNISYTEFVRYCNGNCRDRYKYYADISLSNTTRYVFDKVDSVKEADNNESNNN